MLKLAIMDIARAVGADYAGRGAITDVVTDSRKATPGSLFVPIVGDNMDGHDFIGAAFDNGAAFALSMRRDIRRDDRILFVEDTKLAHIAIAALYRDLFPQLKVVGITGSVGKTTTKEFVAAVLGSRFSLHKNAGNKNNEIGLPETVFGLTYDHEVAVLEMGMSGLGEIHDLACAVKPDIAVITNVFPVHMEYLGSIENIKKAKLEIADGLRPGGTLLLCGDNEHLRDVHIEGVDVVLYGMENDNCHIRATDIDDKGHETTFTIKSRYGDAQAVIPTTGAHFVPDALAAFGVGCAMGLTPDEAAGALVRYEPAGMRQRPVKFRGATVMEDCYNASPVSMQGAIDTFKNMACKGKRIAVFADMRELGDMAREAHLAVGRAVAAAGIDQLMVYGQDAHYYIEGAQSVRADLPCLQCDSHEALAEALRGALAPGDIVWVKGSRGMRLENMLSLLYGGDKT